MSDSCAKAPIEFKYARAAIASARAGLDHIRREQPHSYLALFMALGLLTNTRHVWHAFTVRDRKVHGELVSKWMDAPPPWTHRLQPLLNTARDLLLKEWVALPLVVTGNGRYEIPIYIPLGAKQEAILTDEEWQDRADTTRFLNIMGVTEAREEQRVRIELLGECEDILGHWSAELDRLEMSDQ